MRPLFVLFLFPIALAADPAFNFNTSLACCYFSEGTNRFIPSEPYDTWRDVGYVSDATSNIDVECDVGSGMQIRMNTAGDVQMRAQPDADGECRIMDGGTELDWIYIGDNGGN